MAREELEGIRGGVAGLDCTGVVSDTVGGGYGSREARGYLCYWCCRSSNDFLCTFLVNDSRSARGVDAIVCGRLGGSDSKDRTLLAGWKPVYLSCVLSASACVLLGSVAGVSRRVQGVAGESACDSRICALVR